MQCKERRERNCSTKDLSLSLSSHVTCRLTELQSEVKIIYGPHVPGWGPFTYDFSKTLGLLDILHHFYPDNLSLAWSALGLSSLDHGHPMWACSLCCSGNWDVNELLNAPPTLPPSKDSLPPPMMACHTLLHGLKSHSERLLFWCCWISLSISTPCRPWL